MRKELLQRTQRGWREPSRTHHTSPKRHLDVRALKATVHPAEFYQRQFPGWTPKREHGWVMGPLCPEHADRRPGSFVINLTTGAAVCYSCGFKAGDVIDFTMQRHGLTFIDALRSLAEDWRLA